MSKRWKTIQSRYIEKHFNMFKKLNTSEDACNPAVSEYFQLNVYYIVDKNESTYAFLFIIVQEKLNFNLKKVLVYQVNL